VLLDAKRGDIGTTSDAYAVSAFDELDADAITLSPYMGWDSLAPFVDPKKGYGATKGAFVLCKTSNPSSADVQTLRTVGDGRYVYKNVRRVNSDVWILAPGVGAQGGDLEACCRGAITADGYGLLLPISRGISAAKDPKEAAKGFRDAINKVREEKKAEKVAVNGIGSLSPYQCDFIDLALSCQVLKFGHFTLKSGRKSPYFFNAGLFSTGRAQAKLCSAFAARIVESGIEFDLSLGPPTRVFRWLQALQQLCMPSTALTRGMRTTGRRPRITGRAARWLGRASAASAACSWTT